MTEPEIEKAAEYSRTIDGNLWDAVSGLQMDGHVAHGNEHFNAILEELRAWIDLAFLAGAEHAKPRWIKCSDALPEKDDWVLTYSWGSGVHFERYVGLIYKPDGSIVPKFSDGGDNWQLEFTPSHWSRTPAAPEAESK